MSNRRGIFRGILALAVLTGVACACPKPSESTGALLLDRMQQLAQASSLTVELIRDALEVTFTRDEAASHQMVTFFVGTPRPGSQFEGFIKLVDCRVPTPQNTALAEPFVLVELQATFGKQPEGAAGRAARLWRSDLVAKFGQPDAFQPALPENPKSSGSYVYKVGSRSLWFSLSRQVPDEIVGISVHPLEDIR